MSLTLWLVRHGQTAVNTGVWTAKPQDTRLTLLGSEQAAKAAKQVLRAPDLLFVSPLIRAQQTMHFFTQLWPDAPLSVLPIQEFVYLSPSKLALLDNAAKKKVIADYWLKSDPHYDDGEDAESFTFFLNRVQTFYTFISQQKGYVIVVGHGQFFKAFLLGLTYGFIADSDWMKRYRAEETASPLKNGEIIKLQFA